MSSTVNDARRELPRATVDLRHRDTYVRYLRQSDAIVPKDDFIVELARGRRVLDLGCIDHSAETALALGDEWLHARIRSVAEEVVGIDMLQDDADILNAGGYDIRVADVETLDLGEQFDLVVAGDLIEHLSNVGRFLEAVSHHMHDRAAFVVTTPNPFNAEQFCQAVFRNQVMVNPQHTAWIDPHVMHELVSRSPFEIVDFRWIDTRFHFRLKGGRVVRRIVNPLADRVMRRRPLLRRDYAVVLMLRDGTRR